MRASTLSDSPGAESPGSGPILASGPGSAAAPRAVFPIPRSIPASAIRRAVSRPSASGAIDLALGAPSWAEEPGLELSRRLGSTPFGSGAVVYGPHAGLLELRTAVAALEGVTAEEIQVTCGAQGALSSVAGAFLGPGRVALVPEPGFPAYGALARLAGARVVYYGAEPGSAAGPGSSWVREIEDLLARIGAPTVVFVNNPANPTGVDVSSEELGAVADACDRHGALLVADEVYRPLALGHRASETARPLRGLRIGSLSKGWAAPGLRIGWLVGDGALLEPCRRVHAWSMTSAAGPTQAAAAGLVRAAGEILPASRAALTSRWEAVVEAWRQELGLVPPRPDGGFYLWLPAAGDGAELCRTLADCFGVLAVPGSAFGDGGTNATREWVRLSFAGRPEAVAEGMGRWLRGLAALGQERLDALHAWASGSEEPAS